MSTPELKPCPFCGSQPITFNTGNHFPEIYYRVICPKNCCMQSKLYDSLAEAISDWNRRSTRCRDCPYEIACYATKPRDTLMQDALAYIQQLENHIGELTEKVAQLEAAQPKWISVEERLPGYNAGMRFIVSRNDGTVCEGRFEVSNGRWYELTTEGLWEIEVTHWVPLLSMPVPPKEDA